MKNQAFNPILPSWEYVPDGEPRVFGDRVYLYGSHDQFDGADFCLNDYVCWSAPVDDLSDWRYEGVIYRKDQDPRNKDGKMHMCAPDCVQGPDGKYYLYYQLHVLTCTCVAVADSPVGPFEYYGAVQHPDGTPWGEKPGDSFAFDPGVLVDDDGKVYLYVGHSPAPGIYKTILKLRKNRVEEAVCLELEPDMKTVIGGEHPVVPGPVLARGTSFDGHGFFEASSIRKLGGKYCYVYSSILSHELCYAMSDTPTGGFTYGGTLVSIADLGLNGNTVPVNYTGNTHGGMAKIGNNWYIFYHRQTNKIKCSRQGCAEKLTFLPDGSIAQAEVTSCGLNGGPLKAEGLYEARIACNLSGKNGTVKSDKARKLDKQNLLPYFTQSGKDREGDGDQYIANLKDGAWCGFKYFAFEKASQELILCVRGTGEGVIRVYHDRSSAPIGEVAVRPSADWNEYTGTLSPEAGTQPLFLVFEGSGALDFKAFKLL